MLEEVGKRPRGDPVAVFCFSDPEGQQQLSHEVGGKHGFDDPGRTDPEYG